MLAGMDVARLNFSHGTRAELVSRIGRVRSLNAKYRRRIELLGDLQGHRVRVGDLAAPVVLEKKQTVWLTQEKASSPGKIPFDFQGPLGGILKGHQIFIDDGNIALAHFRQLTSGFWVKNAEDPRKHVGVGSAVREV